MLWPVRASLPSKLADTSSSGRVAFYSCVHAWARLQTAVPGPASSSSGHSPGSGTAGHMVAVHPTRGTCTVPAAARHAPPQCPGPCWCAGRAPCGSPVSEAVPACQLRRAPSSPRRPVPRASPCRSWCPGWPGPSRTTSCGPCATPASAPCTPTASTQVTCRGSLLSPCGLGGRRHPHHGPGSPGGVCSGPGHEGFGDSGEQRLTMRASQQATLPAPFSLGDVVLKQVKFGWGP